jgi:hypothetical protein
MKSQPYFVLLILLAFPGLAHAYIDPGTGSLLIQGLIAAFISVIAFWRNLRMSIANFFRGKKQEETRESSSLEENTGHENPDS